MSQPKIIIRIWQNSSNPLDPDTSGWFVATASSLKSLKWHCEQNVNSFRQSALSTMIPRSKKGFFGLGGSNPQRANPNQICFPSKPPSLGFAVRFLSYQSESFGSCRHKKLVQLLPCYIVFKTPASRR